ncbi:MAG: GAF domain-containing protein [Chitinophagaceae bacterium]|nr:GAF domain-containing protein [Chitinophagaceae bacterium]
MQHRRIEIPDPGMSQEAPIETRLSFKPFLDYVRMRLQDENSIKKEIYRLIVDKFSQYPELEGEIDVEETKKYTDILNLLYIVLSTVVEDEKEVIWGLSVPVSPEIFYGSDALYNLMLSPDSNKLKPELMTGDDDMHDQKCMMLYAFLLENFYRFSFHKKQAMIRPVLNPTTGLWNFYRINLDTRFVNVTTDKPLPELNLENLQVHLHEENGIDILKRILPLTNFRFSGFSILTINDVTPEHALDKIRNILVNGHGRVNEDNYEEISQSFKSLTGTRDIEFTLLPLFRVNEQIVQDADAYSHSILFSMGKQDGILKDFFLPLLEKFIHNPRILYYKDLDQSGPAQQQVGKLFQLAGVKSYALIPVFYSNKLVGAFEMYSRKKGILNEQIFARVDVAMVLVAQLIQNSVEDFNSKIDDTIRDKFTSLQPSVQWKFTEAAWEYIHRSRLEGKSVPIKKIEFKDVYPLYGAIDMRNSTIERNKAVLADLQFQFEQLQKLLEKMKNKHGMALTEDFIFKSNKWQKLLTGTLTTQDELRLNQFLNDEAHPFLRHFRHANADLQPIIQEYFDAIDPSTGKAWEHRRQLEESMQLINGAVNNYLDLMNLEIQQAYPGYFEKFRTDGVEYDIYIGQSIAPNRPFDLVYLKNLRLWQLGSMAAIARLSNQLIPKMKVPLETTQLIFIYSNTIDISFRNDERRFDVEGGYNIRYHIIKKRIDKVNIRNTRERLTQPGKIALIYFNQKDADEYVSYIQHLQEKKVLNDDLEYLELEEVQGISGLKAMRVGVSL